MYRAARNAGLISHFYALSMSKCYSGSPPIKNSNGNGGSKPTGDDGKRSSLTSQKIPRGFEEFYKKKFLRPLPLKDTSKAAIVSSLKLQEKEEVLTAQLIFKSRGIRRGKVFLALTLLFGQYIIYKCLFSSRHDFKADISRYHHIVVNIPKCVALYFDHAKKEIGARQFIDYNALEAASDPNKDIIVDFSSYYPWVSMLLLCLLPLLAMVNSNFSKSAAVAPPLLLGDKRRFRFSRNVNVQTRLTDVAGLTEAKHELIEVIDFLKRPERYTALGATLPKGVLLDGPPGVGKTLLAKAVAGEAQVPFVSCSGSEFDEVYVGVGASRIRELFREAHKCKPCVVFIDEIDSFGRKRKSDGQGNSRSTLNAFLSELDGFKDSSGILVLGATNRADILDTAMTRSGRFDRKITLDKPAYKDRVAIAMVHLRPLRLDTSATVHSYAECIAALTPGCSGADIYNVCNEGAVHAARKGKEVVTMDDFHEAAERVLLGLPKSAVAFQAHEKERLAFHEAGEVVLCWCQELTDPIIKTSILPRGGHRTGVTQRLPQSVFISTEERLRQTIVGTLGGYVSEEHFFKDVSTKAAEKLEKATKLARQMITIYGMDPENIGHIGYRLDSYAIQKPYGPNKENNIDKSVEVLLADSMNRARKILKERLLDVQVIAGLLLKKETLSAHELWVSLGDRPEMTKEFQTYLVS